MITRRSALSVTLATGGAALTGAGLTPLLAAHVRAQPATTTSASSANAPAVVAAPEKFRRPMPLLPEKKPVGRAGKSDVYVMTMKPARAEILPGLTTDVLTYDGHFPGPVIRARSHRPVAIRQRNRLTVPTAVHLHGSSVPADSDGDPMDVIEPGTDRVYHYPNRQPHAPLWFHDHAHHLEAENVYRGLSGSYLLTDAAERALPLPRGRYEVVIALRDARFDAQGQLAYAMGDRGRNTLLANGVPYPYFQVAARKYRLRLLNASNQRRFELRLADGSPLIQIGSDGGLLTAPHTTDRIALSAGERADVVVDFSRYPVGTSVVLKNTTGTGPAEEIGEILRFDVVRTAPDPSRIPGRLRTLPPLPRPDTERTVVLRMDEGGEHPGAYIDEKEYDPQRVDARVKFNSSEVWTVTNANARAEHNFHLHLVQFRVLERAGRPPEPGEGGLKDTIHLAPGETVRLQAVFDSYRGRYLYHCHMFEHGVRGMMATMHIQ
ncbi:MULTISPECIES: multicopper oxidase domain-containing protein [unclassified Streptomyces]|uniref:multicopper oxidase family protein n=1 Tax=unclassified Streptomyces TaxID=2593676 RepID=UPI00136B73C3|nr:MULTISPECIES: multicopper oxidase domain-containing protein [unclassified Streptomyces]NDZ98100.1 multicopper oxidase domain-containing protein [Streptomyces sp. SID10116]MYY83289.1 multicopper oxidase domain-containing protein [Streptomyces sp. SID335]MYZ16141.1 multicopper oxidase domain-containing protein [Streptomyces sp. SID337]NDZ84235.1 multicopper oxidase domain-containing protein [Streptomyces sp. SID10115]NEB50179.1 multicopper oxidase domain-containing protein [Streptomyces sp. S